MTKMDTNPSEKATSDPFIHLIINTYVQGLKKNLTLETSICQLRKQLLQKTMHVELLHQTNTGGMKILYQNYG